MRLKFTTWRTITINAVLLIFSVGLFVGFSSLGVAFILGTLSVYGVSSWIILTRIGASHPYLSFGTANTITMLRLVIACQFAGVAAQIAIAEPISAALAWLLFLLAMLERLLDGIDGFVARKQNMESAFGARFDMEVDAFQILLLSLLALLLDKAGAWVLVGGLLRYAFLGLGLVWLRFNAPLPPSLRRKGVAVLQGVTLAILLAPNVLPPVSTLAAAGALVMLIYSFAIDTLRVARSQSKV